MTHEHNTETAAAAMAFVPDWDSRAMPARLAHVETAAAPMASGFMLSASVGYTAAGARAEIIVRDPGGREIARGTGAAYGGGYDRAGSALVDAMRAAGFDAPPCYTMNGRNIARAVEKAAADAGRHARGCCQSISDDAAEALEALKSATA